MDRLRPKTALLVIDVQAGFDDPAWGRRNNPGMERNVAALLAAWRAARMPVIHVQHDSPDASGLLRHGTPGNAAKPEARPQPGEPVYRKTVNSAFIGTTLATDLRGQDVSTLVLVGLTTNHCVSTTARMAANLGFTTFVVPDATAAFERLALDGSLRPAAEVHDAALSDLQGEFAQLVETRALIAALAARSRANPSEACHA